MVDPSLSRTLAEAGRQRRDLVSGAVLEEAQLVRFVPGPDGGVVPDLACRLPGRGLWVAADRISVTLAEKKNLFARAGRRPMAAPAGLADQVAALLRARLLAGLGMARKAGALVTGFDKVLEAIRGGRAAVVVEATDGARDGRDKLLSAFWRSRPEPLLVGLFSAMELGLALGGENVIHTAFLAGRGADRWAVDARRLSGFCPLFPESWREEP